MYVPASHNAAYCQQGANAGRVSRTALGRDYREAEKITEKITASGDTAHAGIASAFVKNGKLAARFAPPAGKKNAKARMLWQMPVGLLRPAPMKVTLHAPPYANCVPPHGLSVCRKRAALCSAPLSCSVSANRVLNVLRLVPFLALDLGRVQYMAVRVDGFQLHVEAPQPRDVLQDFVRLVVQRPAQVLVVP